MSSDYDEFRKLVNKQAEDLIKIKIPQKIAALNQLMESSLQIQDLSTVYEPLNIAVPSSIEEKLMLSSIHYHHHHHHHQCSSNHYHYRSTRRHGSDGISLGGPSTASDQVNKTVPSNKSLSDLIKLVKPQVKELLEDTNMLKLWMHFMIPKVEDGNNFRVQIQARVLKKIEMIEEFAHGMFTYTSTSYMSRAEMVTKVAKFPHIDDYRRAVHEDDEDNYRILCKKMCEIRDYYCILHDAFEKYRDKIKTPRVGINAMCI